MSLDRKQWTPEQQYAIEHEIRQAMECARKNAMKEARAIAKTVYTQHGRMTKENRKAYCLACTSISVRLERAERMGMPYEPFDSKAGG